MFQRVQSSSYEYLAPLSPATRLNFSYLKLNSGARIDSDKFLFVLSVELFLSTRKIPEENFCTNSEVGDQIFVERCLFWRIQGRPGILYYIWYSLPGGGRSSYIFGSRSILKVMYTISVGFTYIIFCQTRT